MTEVSLLTRAAWRRADCGGWGGARGQVKGQGLGLQSGCQEGCGSGRHWVQGKARVEQGAGPCTQAPVRGTYKLSESPQMFPRTWFCCRTDALWLWPILRGCSRQGQAFKCRSTLSGGRVKVANEYVQHVHAGTQGLSKDRSAVGLGLLRGEGALP